MLLYNLSFPNKEICDEQELYFRGGESRDGSIFVKKGERVRFDTYFNCFSHIKYKKYTKLTDVMLKLETEGRGIVSVCLYKEKETPQVIAQQEISGNSDVYFNIDKLSDEGFVYFEYEATEDSFIRSGGWYADVESDDIKIGIVICTYKREEYLKRNLNNLTAYSRNLTNRFFDVFVIDNGQTVNEDFGEEVSVIPNENTGGSGGFMRGMREVLEKGGYTHTLLMDDDILFDVNALYRTYSLLSVLKDEYKDASVGGAMLILDRPYLQEEIGAYWDGMTIQTRNKRLDARNAQTIYKNEMLGEPDYNAWFYMCVPVYVPEKFGYPLPFFVRCDDVEYGLRAGKHIINMSGISVWHEGFDTRYSPWIEYYNKRNELIVSARYPKGKGAFSNWMKLVLAVGRQLMMQRYCSVDLIFKAYEDFFKGAEWFLSLDSAKYHNELKKYCPQFLAEVEIKEKYGVDIDRNLLQKHKKFGFKNVITLNGYLVPKCFYSKEIAQVDMTRYKYGDFYMKRRVVQFNEKTGTGFVTEIKKSELLKAWGKLIKYFFIMVFKYRKTAKQYAEIM